MSRNVQAVLVAVAALVLLAVVLLFVWIEMPRPDTATWKALNGRYLGHWRVAAGEDRRFPAFVAGREDLRIEEVAATGPGTHEREVIVTWNGVPYRARAGPRRHLLDDVLRGGRGRLRALRARRALSGGPNGRGRSGRLGWRILTTPRLESQRRLHEPGLHLIEADFARLAACWRRREHKLVVMDFSAPARRDGVVHAAVLSGASSIAGFESRLRPPQKWPAAARV